MHGNYSVSAKERDPFFLDLLRLWGPCVRGKSLVLILRFSERET